MILSGTKENLILGLTEDELDALKSNRVLVFSLAPLHTGLSINLLAGKDDADIGTKLGTALGLDQDSETSIVH